MTEARDRLVIALDVSTKRQALELVEQTTGLVGMYKIGSQLFTAEGPQLVRDIVGRGKKVFLDLKFHDIPSTVTKAGIEAARLGVSMFNVHALGGEPMMRRVAEAVREFCNKENLTKPMILGVTILTSLGPSDLAKVYMREEPERLVFGLAELACACGLDGVVASAYEVSLVRHRVDKQDFVIAVPGVRPSWAAPHDQKRTGTPRQVLLDGAQYLVVGRPITESEDPRRATQMVLDEMAAALSGV